MLRLNTLGGLWLEREDASAVVDVRPRWLAFLAVIATGRAPGVTRDQVLAVLWPELDTSRGSHNLSQLLYAIRRHLGVEPIAGDTQMLRLDPAQATSDLLDFDGAVTAGRWADAARIYRGPFLAGFHLDDAPEFERWLDGARDRMARDGEAALERHAEAAARDGFALEARHTWRRLAESDPLNSRFAFQYVMALASSGDRGGAVRHGLAHTALLKEELGSAPPSRLVELLQRLQQGTFVSSQRDDVPPRPAP